MDLVKLSKSDITLEPPQHDLRGRMLLESNDKEFGDIDDLYVDRDERKIRFLEVSTGGIMGIGKKHYLIPIEAVDDETPGAVHLSQSEETIKGSPEFDPHSESDPEFQRAVYEHYGYTVPSAGDQRQA